MKCRGPCRGFAWTDLFCDAQLLQLPPSFFPCNGPWAAWHDGPRLSPTRGVVFGVNLVDDIMGRSFSEVHFVDIREVF